MVNHQEHEMDTVFMALADSTRRGMVARLSKGPATIGELGEPFAITKPAVTKHIKILERAGLLERRKDGRVHHCTLNQEPLQHAEQWIERHRKFWSSSLDALSDYFDRQSDGDQK